MALNHCFLSVEILQYFPQPAGPNNNYENIFESIIPENRFPLLEQEEEEEEEERIEVDEKDIIQILKGCLEDVGAKVHIDSLKKLFSMVGKKFPLERSIREEVQDYRDNAATNMVEKLHGELNHGVSNDSINAERGIDMNSIDRSMGEGVKTKMERFKVKTINLGGVVKEDQK